MTILICIKDTGLSVALLISVFMIFFTKAIVSLTMPWTCKTKIEGIDHDERTPCIVNDHSRFKQSLHP